MSVDQLAKWVFIFAIGLADLALLAVCNVQPAWSDLIVPMVGGLILAALSVHYHRRDGEPLVVCMVTLLHVGCFSTVFSLFMYLTTTFAFPLNDGWLSAIDRALGYEPSHLVAWVRRHPIIEHWSTWVYLFIVPETMIAILAVALSHRRQPLEQFVTQFMLGTTTCAIIAAFFPAGSPLLSQTFQPSDWQQPFVEHFYALRSGDAFVFSWKTTEGLVTFPSFHTAWAIMLIVLLRNQSKWIWVPTTVINIGIILSTLTTGAHYIADVFVGGILAGACVAVSLRWTAFAYHADGTPRRVFWLTGLAPYQAASTIAR